MISDAIAAPENPIRLGIIGCGAITKIAHLKALATLPQFRVDFLCDRQQEAARIAKAEYRLGSEITTEIKDLAGNIDAAIVCVWPNSHKKVTLELLDMGVDVLCEKPIAGNYNDAVAMVNAAKLTQRILVIGQWCRYLRNMWVLRRLLDLEFFGELQEVSAEFGGSLTWPMATGAYYDRTLTCGGVMFDTGIHVVDLVSWLFGDISNIQYHDDSYGGTETNGILRGTVRVGRREVSCRVAASWTHGLRNSLKVVGSEGEAEAKLTEKEMLRVARRVRGERIQLIVPPENADIPFRSPSPQAALLEDFATSIRSRGAPITPGEGTLESMRTIETAYSVRRPMAQPWVDAGVVTACRTGVS
jgi:predicted dehydrogenase